MSKENRKKLNRQASVSVKEYLDQEAIRKASSAVQEESEEVKAMRVWSKIWQNSIQATLRDEIMPVLKETVRSVVREEMMLMVEGFREANTSLSAESFREEIRQEVRSSMQGMFIESTSSFEMKQYDIDSFFEKEEPTELQKAFRKMEIQEHLPVVDIPRTEKGMIRWNETIKNGSFKSVLFKLLQIAEEEGVDITISKQFAKHGTDFNGAYQRYQRYMNKLNGTSIGCWKTLIEEYQSTKVMM